MLFQGNLENYLEGKPLGKNFQKMVQGSMCLSSVPNVCNPLDPRRMAELEKLPSPGLEP
jgi:hypothetical protein